MRLSLSAVLAALCLLLFSFQPQAESEEAISATTVSREILITIIQETEENISLSDELKSQLLTNYRRALSHLEGASVFDEKTAAFIELSRRAPEEIRLIRQTIEQNQLRDPQADITVTLDNSLSEIASAQQQVQSSLLTLESRFSTQESILIEIEGGPAVISQQLETARQSLQSVIASRRTSPVAEPTTVLAESKQWILEARFLELSAEIRMLDQELKIQSLRRILSIVRIDQLGQEISYQQERLKRLTELINQKRQIEADSARARTERERQQLANQDPLFARLAQENTQLTTELQFMADELSQLSQELEQASKIKGDLDASLRDAQVTIERSGFSEGLGEVLLQQRQRIPDLQRYHRRIAERQSLFNLLSVRRLEYREEARRIADLPLTVEELSLQLTIPYTEKVDELLTNTVRQRQSLLAEALEAEAFYQEQLITLDLAEHDLVKAARAYRAFVAEKILWLRTSDRLRLTDVQAITEDLMIVLSPQTWTYHSNILWMQIRQSKPYWMIVTLSLVLITQRKTLLREIAKCSNKPTHQDRFAYTLWAFFLTLLIPLPAPAVLAATGWQLQVAAQSTDISYALGESMLLASQHLLFLRVLRNLCINHGVARAHFNWPAYTTNNLRRQLDRFSWLFAVLILLVSITNDLNPIKAGGTISRMMMLLFFLAMLPFFYAIFHPRSGVLRTLRDRKPRRLIYRGSNLYFALIMAFPSAMIVLTIAGYTYTSGYLTLMFVETLWVIVGLAVLMSLALRWVLVTSRQLAYKEALLRYKQRQPDQESEEADHAIPAADVTTLSKATRELLRLLAEFAAILGLYLIWSPLLPALRIFDEFTLWTYTVTESGIDTQIPYSIADLGVVLFYILATVILARHLPAALEIILLQRFSLSSGNRYTIVTMTTYIIVSIGIILVLNAIGARWSQLQWLIAALGVGIGFGLQEIVANFISGLIILFERPIRVGDTVTVAGTSGVVTRIRIRATTIRGWDCKELLVPNKEFVTGRLLNWSLSDQTSRIVIQFGIRDSDKVAPAMELLSDIARDNPLVLREPAPLVTFDAFDATGHALCMRAYVEKIEYRLSTQNALNLEINNRFRDAGIAIVFPLVAREND